ncbi:MAG: phenylacetic acid degradation operon negative regulatory protein PaaX [Gemmatimonadales bacterium]|nr:MAG: phenylacetic acid degradation operon negative regulatory protein PaaX [Gemmatimonadales bacterium]
MDSGRPQDLIFTLFGDYLLHRPVPVWAGSLIRLLQPLGMSETSARTTLSRMGSRGWLKSERVGRHSYYDLTPRGRRLLQAGESRIFHPDWDKPWDGSWLLLAYSIPEDERVLRDRIRDRLAWLGFGTLRSGLWISPHDVEDEVREITESLDISTYIDCFRATGVAFTDPESLVERGWDLAAINERYMAFIDRQVPDFQRFRAEHETSSISPEESFVRRFRLTHEYRDFPLIDPYLPRTLLPGDWAGECAAHLFRTYHDLLSPPAEEYVKSILASAPTFLPPDVFMETPR